MDQDSFPHLVPLSTLQYNLHRQLYPFDFLDLGPEHPLPPAMSQPPQSPKASASPPPASSSDSSERNQSSSGSSSAAQSTSQEDGHACQWMDCQKVLGDPETLYNHLCNDHIGRKSTGNLCLTCKWKDCGTTCAKRDHITSHLRGTSTIPSAAIFESSTHAYNSAHTPEAPCLRYMQETLQAATGSQEAREDSHRRAPRPAQALESYHRYRPHLQSTYTRR